LLEKKRKKEKKKKALFCDIIGEGEQENREIIKICDVLMEL
jgi:hypothetical protein